MSWPETVPVLTKRDMYKFKMNGPNGEHCLLGWRNEVFGDNELGAYNGQSIAWDVYEKLSEVCREKWGYKCEVGPDRTVINANDRLATYDEAAEIWNEAMRRLGYTEVIEI
jgi:hypothetical protein